MGVERRCRVAALLPLLLLGAAWSAVAQPADATHLLARMNQALRTTDYEGTLVFLSDNRMETLHLVHRSNGGQVHERMVSLSGPVRTVSREPDRVTCVLAEGRPISVERHGAGKLLQPDPIDVGAILAHYRVEVLGRARIAGRDTDVIAIRPRDDLRYGLELQLDSHSGLPLKTDLIDVHGEPLEQLMFTSVELSGAPQAVLAAEARQPSDADISAPAPAPAPASASASASERWRFVDVPAGFEQRMHDLMVGPGGQEMEHFLFSDRLSAYSVYVEPGGGDGLDGVTRIGAIHAAGREVDGHQVTAVGEVPAATVRAAVNGVRAAAASPVSSADR